MHHADWNQYIYYLQQQIEQQNMRISSLEMQIEELKAQKGITIEKMEYQFDQLKINTLSGSLQIGLSPDELNKIEDLACGQQIKPSSMHLSPLDQEILAELNQWCQQFGPQMIRNLAHELEYQLDESQIELFIQDIRSQFPKRILHYQQEAINDRTAPQDHKRSVIETIQQEVIQSLRKYMANQKSDNQ